MRRNSLGEMESSQINKDVDNLIYRFDVRNEAQLRDILSSPKIQRELQLYYNNRDPAMADQFSRMQFYQHNDSLTSLTDSEFYSDDQNPPIRFSKQKAIHSLTRFGRFIDMIAQLPWPRMSVTGMGLCFLVAVFICPRACDENLLFPAFRLLFGTLYPAYASYKAVRTKNVKEYVKWMMYWIVYAFFTCIETFTDIFLSWFPFYYEVKVIIVIWLLSPATKGSSTLYRKFVHPMLTRREQEIDEYINQAKEKGYTAVLQLGSKGVNYATNVIMQTALKTIQAPGTSEAALQTSRFSLVQSRSDYGITSTYSENNVAQDLPDGMMLRSRSVETAISYQENFEGSSEDEDLVIEYAAEAVVDKGAARIRDPPKRKTKNVTVSKAPSNKSSKIAIRGRRKIKPEPEDLIDVD